MTHEVKKKWKRASNFKSKAGCMSCKRRRIKCDESRQPGCLRCQKGGWECDFTKSRSTIPTAKSRSLPPLLPKLETKLSVVRLNSSERVSIEVELDNRYFDDFRRKSASGFQCIMGWKIWSHLMLQLCHQESFVRDSIVAIGALMRSLEAVTNSSRDLRSLDEETYEIARLHKQFALLKYDKALKAMKSVIDREPRQILVSCLLVFCFEILLGNRTLALPQIVTGHRVLQDFLSRHHRSILIDHISHSPEPALVDDELLDAFEHLDLQISTIYDVRPMEMHRAIVAQGRGLIKEMPSVFSTLLDAGRYLAVVMRQSHHFLATAWQSTQPEALLADFAIKPPGPLPWVSGYNSHTIPYIVPDFLRIEQRSFANDVVRWSAAYEPLFQRIQLAESPGSKDQVTSAMLKLQAIATRIMVGGVLITEELDYDLFLPQFREMLTLIETIIGAYKKVSDEKTLGNAGFVLGLGITAPLCSIVTRCRDRKTRRRGIEILETWRREACWDAGWDPLLIAEIGKFIIDVEEDGVPDGIIPEASRAITTRICEASGNGDGTQQALIQVVQRRGAEDGGPLWRERMVYFGSHR